MAGKFLPMLIGLFWGKGGENIVIDALIEEVFTPKRQLSVILRHIAPIKLRRIIKKEMDIDILFKAHQ